MTETKKDDTISTMTTTRPFNETALDRELRFLDRHIDRLERLQEEYNELTRELQWSDEDGPPSEDRVWEIHNEQTDLEIELVLLPACYARKTELEGGLL